MERYLQKPSGNNRQWLLPGYLPPAHAFPAGLPDAHRAASSLMALAQTRYRAPVGEHLISAMVPVSIRSETSMESPHFPTAAPLPLGLSSQPMFLGIVPGRGTAPQLHPARENRHQTRDFSFPDDQNLPICGAPPPPPPQVNSVLNCGSLPCKRASTASPTVWAPLP